MLKEIEKADKRKESHSFGRYWPALVCTITLLAGLALAPAVASAAGKIKIGTYAAVVGDVATLREKHDAPIKAEIGQDVYLSDVIKTSRRSRVQLKFIDDSVLNMGPGHMVKVKEYVYNEDKGIRKAVLSAFQGTVRVAVPNSRGRITPLRCIPLQRLHLYEEPISL